MFRSVHLSTDRIQSFSVRRKLQRDGFLLCGLDRVTTDHLIKLEISVIGEFQVPDIFRQNSVMRMLAMLK